MARSPSNSIEPVILIWEALAHGTPAATEDDDWQGQASPALSSFIACALELHGDYETPTLATIRQAIRNRSGGRVVPLDRLSSARLAALREEVDTLILAHGEQSQAMRFLRPWLSAPLRRLIAVADPGCTLDDLLRGLNAGLSQSPMADGGLTAGEAELVDAELRALAARYGHQMPAWRLVSRSAAESTIPTPASGVPAR